MLLVLDRFWRVGYQQSVHPGRGFGHDGDLDGVDAAPAGLVRRTLKTREPWAGPVDTTVHCALSGKTTPAANNRHRAIWGSARASPTAKTAAKAWTRDFASTAGRHDRHFCESLRPRNPSLPSTPGNGITVFTPGEAVPNAD